MTTPTPAEPGASQLPVPSLTSPAQRSPQHQLFFLALGVVLVSGCLVALTISHLKTRAIESGEHLTESFAHVIEEQTTRTVQTIDQRLELAANSLEQLDLSEGLTEQSARALLYDQIKAQPFIRALWVMDTQGRILYESGSGNRGLSLADRDYFQIYLTQPQTQLYIGAPVRGRTTGKWTISVARPYRSPQGVFKGVIAAAIEPSYFDKLWGTIDLGVGGSVTLFRRDGLLMMRSPFDDAVMGKSFHDRPLFTSLLPKSPADRFQNISPIDGIFRIFAYRTLSTQPDMAVVVGLSHELILAPWRRLAILAAAIWLAASAAVVTLCLFLGRAWQQRIVTETRIEQMAKRLTLATDAASIGVWDWNIDNADQWYATPTYFTMLGYDPQEGFANRTQWIERLHPDDKEAVSQRIQAVLAGNDIRYEYEARLRHANGAYRWVHVVGRVLKRDHHGKPTRLMGVRTDITERKQAEATLRQNERQLRALSRRVLEAQETERRRVAMELHDELGQSLTAIKINLQAHAHFKGHSPDELDTENIRIVENALQQVRHLALALRPSMLDDLGLVPALRWIAEQAAARSGFTAQLISADLQTRLSPEIETTCFRVAQEAMTNIARHAKAQHVEIEVRLDGSTLMLSVQDDGCGFDLAAMRARAAAGGSIGVLGMQERATLIGGQLDIESTPGQGSIVRLRCPLRRRGELA